MSEPYSKNKTHVPESIVDSGSELAEKIEKAWKKNGAYSASLAAKVAEEHYRELEGDMIEERLTNIELQEELKLAREVVEALCVDDSCPDCYADVMPNYPHGHSDECEVKKAFDALNQYTNTEQERGGDEL